MLQQTDNQLFLYARKSFGNAGVDNYSEPPAQDPESFELLTNVMPVTTGGLTRRWGYALFNNPALLTRRMYEFQNDTTLARRIVVTSTAGVESVTEAGAAGNTGIFTPDASARSPRMLTSRSYAYFADGVAADLKKWDGSDTAGATVTKWGIAAPSNATTSTALTAAGAIAEKTVAGSIAWTNPGNATTSNDVYATVNLTPGQIPKHLVGTTFGFALPVDATIIGATCTFEANTTDFTQETISGYIYKGGNIAGSAQTNTIISGGTDQNVAIGSLSTLSGFNVTLTPAEVNSVGFGCAVGFATNNAGNTTFSADSIRMQIAYSTPIQVSATVAGSVTLISGRKYTVAFYNSTTRHFSDIAEFSISTGPITTDDIPLTAIPVSTDTQVDRKILLATADGGD